jgi:hypothetical protein
MEHIIGAPEAQPRWRMFTESFYWVTNKTPEPYNPGLHVWPGL